MLVQVKYRLGNGRLHRTAGEEITNTPFCRKKTEHVSPLRGPRDGFRCRVSEVRILPGPLFCSVAESS